VPFVGVPITKRERRWKIERTYLSERWSERSASRTVVVSSSSNLRARACAAAVSRQQAKPNLVSVPTAARSLAIIRRTERRDPVTRAVSAGLLTGLALRRRLQALKARLAPGGGVAISEGS
jgi:hypothetical protein